MLVMTLLVRDEVDIVRDNLLFHLNGPVDHVIATDNGSQDGTREVLEEFSASGVLTLLDEPGDDYSQAVWVTRMADIALERFGSAWILNNDADEFWMVETSDLRRFDSLGWGAVRVPRLNMFASTYPHGCAHFAQGCRYRFREPTTVPWLDDIYDREGLIAPYLSFDLPPKALAKLGSFRTVAQGNHSVDLIEGVGSGDADFSIYHFPVRSPDQFHRKVEAGGRAYARNRELDERVGWHWRRWHRFLSDTGGIETALYDAVPDGNEFEEGLREGRIVEDRTFLETLRSRLGPPAGSTCLELQER